MDNTKTITCHLNDIPKFKLATPCMICGEGIEYTEEENLKLLHGHCIHSKICDKCKNAVLHIRKQLDNKE